jgi:hypothetical protein
MRWKKNHVAVSHKLFASYTKRSGHVSLSFVLLAANLDDGEQTRQTE